MPLVTLKAFVKFFSVDRMSMTAKTKKAAV